jgi:formylglycine-generating enzyme required for sulfatase activity
MVSNLRRPTSTLLSIATALIVMPLAPAGALTVDWVSIADPGNLPDPVTGIGSVPDAFEIARTEVTNTDYVEFLNAVAVTDANGLYNTSMAGINGGISRTGSSGSHVYSVMVGRGDRAVNFVSAFDAFRFINWLHNGQPMGVQDATTTEEGAYSMSPAGEAGNTIVRNPGATIFLPTRDEWYKAAYYEGGGGVYYDHPIGSDSLPACSAPSSTANTANCGNAVGAVADVGSYPNSPSPHGTLDQGGNVAEWAEDIDTTRRRNLGGFYASGAGQLGGLSYSSLLPTSEYTSIGFRVARAVDEPPPLPALGPMAVIGLTVSLLAAGAVARRR